jgi:hypothetical protein
VALVVLIKIRVCVEIEQGQRMALRFRGDAEGWIGHIMISAQEEIVLVPVMMEIFSRFNAPSKVRDGLPFLDIPVVANSPPLGKVDTSLRISVV